MDFDETVKQYENDEIEKDKFVELVKDRIQFLEKSAKEAYSRRDKAKAELKELKKENSSLDPVKDYFNKEIEVV